MKLLSTEDSKALFTEETLLIASLVINKNETDIVTENITWNMIYLLFSSLKNLVHFQHFVVCGILIFLFPLAVEKEKNKAWWF